MELFAYIDETASDRTSGPGIQLVGAGALFTDAPVGKEVINEAIASLRVHPDLGRYPKSKLNIEKEVFHASKDSPISKECFFKSVNSQIKGEFCCYFTDIDSQREIMSPRSIEEIYRSASRINLAAAHDLPVKKLNIFIESRREFSKSHIEQWIETSYANIDAYAYEFCTSPQYYPSTVISLTDKTNPGVQVSDYLLWMYLRRIKIQDYLWSQFLRQPLTVIETEIRGEFRGSSTLNNFNYSTFNYPYIAQVDPLVADKYLSYQLIFQLTDHLSMHISEIDHGHIEHLVNEYRKRKRNSDYSLDFYIIISKIFLRSFDTLDVPQIFNANSHEKFLNLINAKYIAACALKSGSITQTRVLDKMSVLRRQIVDSFCD